MIERLIPKYPIFLILGLVLVASGLFFLTAGRDALIAVWVDKLFNGEMGEGLFEASQTAEQAIGHTLTVWLFLGLAFLKLGIGFAIATIVGNLRATWRNARGAYASAGVAGAEADGPTEPWFGRLFTRFLFAGILVMGFFFLTMLWWDINLVFLKDAEFDGRTSGAAYNTYLMVDRVLGPIIGSGRFLAEGLLFLRHPHRPGHHYMAPELPGQDAASANTAGVAPWQHQWGSRSAAALYSLHPP